MDTPGSWLIGAASRLVPRARRDSWRREWEAETAYAWTSLRRSGRTSRFATLRLWARILTCTIDALWERKETMKMTGFLNDVRYALRGLLRYPAFTTVAVITLALGIGATTAVFTLVDGVLIRPLPFPRPDRLLAIEHQGRDGQDQLPISSGLYVTYREQAASLEAIAMYQATVVNLVGEGEPERIPAEAVTPSFFQVLGVQPVLGRTFTEEEGAPDGEQVVVLSDGLWRRNFGADPSVVGRTLDMNGVSRKVVGVMPPDFGHPNRDAQVWLPLVVDQAQVSYGGFGAGGIARLSSGSSLEGAATELQGLVDRLSEFAPADEAAFLKQVNLKAVVHPLKEAVVGDVGRTLWILLGTVGFVLLIACANVANLLLVRAEGRQRELALRVAVGAGRAHVLRAFMGESLLLAAAGGALGVAVAALAVRVSLGLVPTDIPRIAEVGVDLRVLGFSALVSLGCAVFFGFFPLVRYGTGNLANQLREGGSRGGTTGRERHRLRNTLVVVQVAIALVLLVGSGLMFRSFVALRAVDPGFRPVGVLTARLSVPTAEIPGAAETADFFLLLRERLAAQQGVEAAGLVGRVPLSGGVSFMTIEVEDQPRAEGELPVFAFQASAGPGYFETMGIPLLEGRTFRREDGAAGTHAVVVGKAFAQHWWPDQSAVGRRLRSFFPDEDWWEIVGVVGDVHLQSLEDQPGEMVYFPPTFGAAANPFVNRTLDVVVRTSGDPLQFVAVLRREVRDLNPRIPLANPRTMQDVFEGATARTSFTMALLGSASGIALILGLVGIYGVISYLVSQRTREIGVRMALGASAPSVRAMVVRQGLTLAGAGVAVGLVAAGLLSSLMSTLLYGISATDPVTYGAVALALVAVATLASWLPARRAAGVDPSRALRAE